MQNYKFGYTHNGVFHADDVFSAALLLMLFPALQIARSSSLPVPFPADALAFDIGGGRFDHHMPQPPTRADGSPYAAFGLLWSAFGSELVGSRRGADAIETRLVIPLDTADNGGAQNPLSAAVSAMNPQWNDNISADAAFFAAVDFARTVLSAMVTQEQAADHAESVVRAALAEMQNGVVILERYVPWQNVLPASAAEFVVYPSARGGWNVQGVPVAVGSRAVKIPFPPAWRGLSADDLSETAGIPLQFCHPSGFLCAADSLETAVAAASLCKIHKTRQNY